VQPCPASFDISLLARPTTEKSFGTQFGRKRTKFGELARGEESRGDIIRRKIGANELQINSNFATQTECEHGQAMRVRQIEASGPWGFLGIERRFLLRPIPKSQPCGSTGQVFSQQIPQYSPSRYVVIPVAIKHKPLRAALFILRKSGF
jgi:hypothetical protein